ncbi:MAG TPA: 3-deoxy-7-phosphoheptulonate synthase [Termitinemataceae bacterium]|uniref:3-deoxy-7-phosphoheptulonate synthase n=1 Tax=Treponema sp. J25 TaxID=2094121 RepID=UPI0010466889|nr:3-deoxy-7-phosphoheptulonate synthase [Treponema sp. J25]TCW60437.1 3-deoxy-7-phosphoheptulonate synthase [Treponema sp. J25]HOJ98432.1 3-deoxy-7-phosphoheptulonate synthase [Termitinemataceae bacterium]HOM22798.1 3-deoxy-7-phosphoheptulonate synthase [Termitinemataceae bacterium]HPP99739.1 3-deoxy-7-phosphoheptulonate synthase [Termitinemataceae bacterium]
MIRTNNLRIVSETPLISPAELAREIPMTDESARVVFEARRQITNIIHGQDRRLLAIVGPCSIHDPEAALDYGRRLAELAKKYADRLCIVMRVYFEKPRTALGWRGLIVDPNMDDSYDIARGLRLARRLLVQLNDMGLPAGSEMLDPIIPQYIAELISWASIGARTTESQTHREMASGLSMPIGFKNATDGDVQIAINAIVAASSPHSFVGIDKEGTTIVMRTTGNPDCHLILRGGKGGANFDRLHVAEAAERMKKAGLRPSIVIDCSHGNSEKKPERQALVLRDLLVQRREADSPVVGFMLESNLEPGCQSPAPGGEGLRYGVSVTDPCIGWDETAALLEEAWLASDPTLTWRSEGRR